MVNDGFEIFDGLDVPLHKRCIKLIHDKMQMQYTTSDIFGMTIIPHYT